MAIMTAARAITRAPTRTFVAQALTITLCLVLGAFLHAGFSPSKSRNHNVDLVLSRGTRTEGTIADTMNSSRHACSWVDMDRPAYPLRKKLMIIIYETIDRKDRQEIKHVVDNFSKYCDKHGYLFKLHYYVTDDAVGVFGTRWTETLKFW